VWESNPPLRLERAVSSADRRTSHRVGRGALESPSAGLQPAAGPSQLPTRFAVSTKRPGVLRHTGPETPHEGWPWPGVTSARDRARAGSPVDRRIASLPYNPGCDADSRRTWTTSVQGMSQADSTGDRAHRPARRLPPLQTRHPGGMFARFRGDSWIASPAALLIETDRTIRDRKAHSPASFELDHEEQFGALDPGEGDSCHPQRLRYQSRYRRCSSSFRRRTSPLHSGTSHSAQSARTSIK
jgi:hypothetical protein